MDKRVPEMRFKGFTDDWEQHSLDEMANDFTYGLNASSVPYDGKNKYIRITDINDSSHKINNNNLTSPNVNVSESKEYLLKEGDLLFARTGASVGKTYLYNELDGIAYFAGFLIRMRIKQNYSSQFIYQNTLTEYYNNFVKITSQRSGQPGINANEYSKFAISVPTKISEQIKVGKILYKIDCLVDLQQRELDFLKNGKKGLMDKLFPSNGNMVPSITYAKSNGNWEQRKLGEITTERNERSKDGELLSVTINNGINRTVSLNRKNSSSDDKSNYKKVYKGDIAYNSMRMWQGASGVSKYNGIVSPAYTVLYVNHNFISNEFLGYTIKSHNMTWKFRTHSQGLTSDTWNLKYPLFSKIDIKYPSLYEQIKIEKCLETFDSLIYCEEQKLNKLSKLKKFFLQKLFI